ncbi:hypothetical protein [Fuerstiella marisgermanici]|uniref:hypothetical protein n=1 Tax=Fuerstiella marisgermanici TaxID=1891926 RepID=UPI00097C02AD|nr:hypothetical protein [Fuerstiella marisgermanici]
MIEEFRLTEVAGKRDPTCSLSPPAPDDFASVFPIVAVNRLGLYWRMPLVPHQVLSMKNEATGKCLPR